MSFHDTDVAFMALALEQAELAYVNGEIPVGCVFVDDSTKSVITSGHNKTNESRNGTKHAEIVAVEKYIDDQPSSLVDVSDQSDDCDSSLAMLRNSSLYVTCEPCIMCAALLGKIGVKKVYFGCMNDRFGGNGSILSVHNNTELSAHSYEAVSGLLKDKCIEIFQRFYESENRRAPESKRRKKNK